MLFGQVQIWGSFLESSEAGFAIWLVAEASSLTVASLPNGQISAEKDQSMQSFHVGLTSIRGISSCMALLCLTEMGKKSEFHSTFS